MAITWVAGPLDAPSEAHGPRTNDENGAMDLGSGMAIVEFVLALIAVPVGTAIGLGFRSWRRNVIETIVGSTLTETEEVRSLHRLTGKTTLFGILEAGGWVLVAVGVMGMITVLTR